MTEQQTLDLGEVALARSAVISEDGLYRYRLDRRWGYGPRVAWIMLNPSTADSEAEDATSRRVQAFSRRWGFSALTVVNLYAWRATDPTDLWTAQDPVGPENDRHIAEVCAYSHRWPHWRTCLRGEAHDYYCQLHNGSCWDGGCHYPKGRRP